EAAGVFLHLVGVAGDNDFVGAEAQCVLLLVRRGGEDNDVGSKRVSKFYRHVAEPAETNDADFLALANAPVAHRRVRRDARAKERRGSGEFEIGRDAQNEALIDYRSEEHTSELQSRFDLVCRLLLEKKNDR